MIAALFIWALLATAAYVALTFWRPSFTVPSPLIVVGTVAAVVRLFALVVYPDPLGLFAADIENYQETARLLLDRRDVYALDGPLDGLLHPYPPFHMYLFMAASWIADRTEVTFFTLVRLPNVAADAGIAVLIAHARLRDGGRQPAAVGDSLLYALCPLPIMVGTYHGQFDSTSVFLALAAWYVLHTATPGDRRALLSAALIAMATLDKPWALMLFPVLLLRSGDIRGQATYAATYAAVIAAGLGLYVAVFSSSPAEIVGTLRDYRSPFPNSAGLMLVLDELSGWTYVAERALDWNTRHYQWLMLAAVAVTIVVTVGEDAINAIVAVIAAIFATTTDGAMYHAVWIVPFAIVAGMRWWLLAFLAPTMGVYFTTSFVVGVVGPSPDWLPLRDWFVENRTGFAVSSWAVVTAWWLWLLTRGLLDRHSLPERRTPAARESAAASSS